jgi:proliferating cell nuclear antigen
MAEQAKSELQFSAISRTAELWKSISSAIITVVDEAHFEANNEDLQFRSMDASHVALIDVSCPAVAFEKYECPIPIKFGFKVDDFAKVVKRASGNESVELGLADSMLNVKTTGVGGGYIKNYKLKLIESPGGTSTPVPKLSFDSKLVISPSILDRILSDIEVVNNKVTIETTADKQAIFSTNSETGEARIMIDDKSGIENLNEISVGTPAKATFGTEFITKIVKAAGPYCQLVSAELAANKPLKLIFTLPNAVKIEFFMAPRVED